MKRLDGVKGPLLDILICVVLFWLVVGFVAALFGCTPPVHPIDVSAKRVDEMPQNVHDLEFPCDLCGKPAKMCPVENWYRCGECSRPKDARPRVKLKQRRLPVQIVRM